MCTYGCLCSIWTEIRIFFTSTFVTKSYKVDFIRSQYVIHNLLIACQNLSWYQFLPANGKIQNEDNAFMI